MIGWKVTEVYVLLKYINTGFCLLTGGGGQILYTRQSRDTYLQILAHIFQSEKKTFLRIVHY